MFTGYVNGFVEKNEGVVQLIPHLSTVLTLQTPRKYVVYVTLFKGKREVVCTLSIVISPKNACNSSNLKVFFMLLLSWMCTLSTLFGMWHLYHVLPWNWVDHWLLSVPKFTATLALSTPRIQLTVQPFTTTSTKDQLRHTPSAFLPPFLAFKTGDSAWRIHWWRILSSVSKRFHILTPENQGLPRDPLKQL